MPKYKLINSLSSVITEIVLGGLSGVKNPDTGKPFDQNVGIDFTKSDTDVPGKIIGKWSGELGTSSIFKTTCDAPLEEQVFKIIRGEEGFISKMRYDESWFRMGYGSMTTTYSDGTWETLPSERDHSDGSECDSPMGFQYCTHPVGKNKYGVPWVDYEITEEDALRDFNRITKNMRDEMEKYVGSEIWSETPDCVKASLNSLAYNCGSVRNFILDAIKEKDYCKAADGIESVCLKSQKTNIDLSPRRRKEAGWIRECTKCLTSGEYTSTDINTGEETSSNTPVDLLIGDSTCPYVEAQTRAKRRPGPEGFGKLQKGGISIYSCVSKDKDTLYNYVNNHPLVEPHVKNVVISIGTNDLYQENCPNDVKNLVNAINKKFPNAKLLVVQGTYGNKIPCSSAGYCILKNTKQSTVDNYYKKFEDLGVTVIDPPIGNVENCHGHLPIYKEIGKNIDANLQ